MWDFEVLYITRWSNFDYDNNTLYYMIYIYIYIIYNTTMKHACIRISLLFDVDNNQSWVHCLTIYDKSYNNQVVGQNSMSFHVVSVRIGRDEMCQSPWQ